MITRLPEFAIPIVFSSIIVVAGWFVVSLLSWQRTVKEKQKERRLSYLISAYDNLRLFEEYGIRSYEDFKRFQKLLSDIYLFGTLAQIKVIDELPEGTLGNFEIRDLNKLIVKEIREELGLPFYEGKLGKKISWSGVRNFINQESRFDRLMNCLLVLTKSTKLSSMDEKLHDSLVEITVLGTKKQVEIAEDLLKNTEGIETENLMDELIKNIRYSLRFQIY